MKNKTIIILIIVFILILIPICVFLNKSNLEKLSYDEVIAKLDNKEDFVLCVSASDCIHCKKYKPKLKEISNTYDIKIYYVDVDAFTEEEYDNFKTRISFDGATPITIFFKDGEEKTTATRIEGNASTDKIINKLKKNGFIRVCK